MATKQPSALRRILLPNRRVDGMTALALVAAWAVVALAIWILSPFATLPTPVEVWKALGELWWEEGLGPELATTLKLIFHALGITILIAMALSYLSVIALFRPVVEAASKLRFLGITGLVFPFTLLTGGGYSLKVALLTFGTTTFFITAMARVIVEIPKEELEYMRALGASEGRIFWEVIVRGTLDRAVDVLRQNAAIGWAMITMVEGISRAEGGVGALILNENKHFRLAEVYALLLVILVVGLAMDYGFGVLGRVVCPWAALDRVKR